MNDKDILAKCKKHMLVESIVKSALCGLSVGMGVDIIVAFLSWLFGFSGGLWLAIGLGVGIAAGSAVIFYYKLFKPDPVEVARRLDSLGLDERVITSLELEGSDTELARMQRADVSYALTRAHEALGKKMFSFSMPVAIIVAVSVLGTGAVAVDTVSGLSAEGLIPSGTEIIDPDREQFVEVSFVTAIWDSEKEKPIESDDCGIVDGDVEQVIKPGEYCDWVLAIADDGWAFGFWYWEDADEEYTYEDPSLEIALSEDAGLNENIKFYAVFYQVGEGGDGEAGDGGGEGDEGDEGDDADDQPQEGDDGDNEDDNDNNDNNNNNNENQNPGGNKPDPNNPGNGASGKYDDNNQIIDGNTHYRDVYKQYYEQAMQILAEGGEVPPELRAIIETYFGIIL